MRKVLLAVLASVITCGWAFAAKTEAIYLSGTGSDNTVEWDFFCTGGRNSGKWGKIAVPSCWESQGYGNFNYGQDSKLSNEEGLYKHNFNVPKEWKGKRVFIVFEGSMTDTEIKVNGKSAGDVHQGSFYRFKREITGLVKYGTDNLLEVKVSKMSANTSVNAAEREADYWVFGGIYRPVYIEAQPVEFIEYIATDAKADGSISVEINLDGKAKEATAVKIELKSLDGKVIKTFTGNIPSGGVKTVVSGKIEGVEVWTAETPNRYSVTATIERKGKELHTISEKIGFRTVEVRARDGVYVNGAKMKFKGVNRPSFWPTTGRTTSLAISIMDANLIKEMNMNAVRMSHYPPDKHFLDVCDSLGLYVIDELCAWQSPPYDTKVGTILAQEMLKRDLNHPSIVIWANGNEGGFNFDLDHIFPDMDPQKRTVIHPWALFGGINTLHYIMYNSGVGDMFHGREIFMPTELIHGLYDGGHGAGLDDFWNLMLSNPLSAGMFLWDFVDQGVVRVDKNGEIDTDIHHGADGIVGPYREKEGSFFTIKEIWSPVFIEKILLTKTWDGTLRVQNRYDFTNLSQCKFSYKLARIGLDGEKEKITGNITSPSVKPWELGVLKLSLPTGWYDYDVLYLTAADKEGKELYTTSFEIGGPKRMAERSVNLSTQGGAVKMTEDASSWMVSASGVEVTISKENGTLLSVKGGNGGEIPFKNGPVFASEQEVVPRSVKYAEAGGVATITADYGPKDKSRRNPFGFVWKIHPSGIVQLDFRYKPAVSLDYIGISFDYPEEGVEGVDLIANGPYRVYKNRLKGGTLGVWDKKYNNSVTGESWDYPEFKGYYSLFYAMEMKGKYPFKVYCASEDVFLRLFTPAVQKGMPEKSNYTLAKYPVGNISFMHGITPVGTKFDPAPYYGPQSQPYTFRQYGDAIIPHGTLYFDFSVK